MKYEFHVGDYVETIGGFVGWIYQMRDDGYIWVANKDVASCSYRMPEELRYFRRIGQYDFTRPNKNRIEPLKNSFVLDPTDEQGEYHHYSREIIIKVGELIDAVNKLLEVNEDD